MARSDLFVFQKTSFQVGTGEHNLESNTFKLGIINSTITPVVGQETPSWGDFSANEVSTGGGYVAGGITLANVTFTEAAGISTFDADPVTLAQDPAGFTDAYWGIIYDDTNATDAAIAFIDLGGPVSEVDSPIEFNWNASGILRISVTGNP